METKRARIKTDTITGRAVTYGLWILQIFEAAGVEMREWGSESGKVTEN